MRPGKSFSLAASALSILALVFAVYFSIEARKADRARAAIAHDHASLDASLSRARQEADAREREAAAQRVAGGGATDASHAPGGSPPTGAPRAKSPAGPSVPSLLAADPKLMELYLKSFRAGLPDRYGLVYARLGLSRAQIDKFEELTTAHEGETMDLQGAAEAQGLDSNDPGIAAMRQQSNKQWQQAVLAFVTEAGISVAQVPVEGRLATPQIQSLIGNLATGAAAESAPLTYAQAGQLAPILADATVTNTQARTQTLDWDKALAQAAGVLSAPQLEALRHQATTAQIADLAHSFHKQEQAATSP